MIKIGRLRGCNISINNKSLKNIRLNKINKLVNIHFYHNRTKIYDINLNK